MKMGISAFMGKSARAAERSGRKEGRQCTPRRSVAKPGEDSQAAAMRPGNPAMHQVDAGFTLIELLVVIAIIAILAAVLLPVLHQAQLRGQTATCIDNQKQMVTAWMLYATDNNDACVGNNWPNERTWLPVANQNQNWVSGWLGADGSGGNGLTSGVGGPDNTNTFILTNPKYAVLGDFTKVPKLYLCPASVVEAPVKNTSPPYYLMVRSVSMNCWVGWNCVPPGANNTPYESGAPTPDYSGCLYKTFSRTTDMRGGGDPADIIVFVEERAESIDDGSFEIAEPTKPGQAQGSPNFPNIPTDYHNEAATLAFGDGHVDVHRWHDPVLLSPQQQIVKTKAAGWPATSPCSDWYWLAQHGTVPK